MSFLFTSSAVEVFSSGSLPVTSLSFLGGVLDCSKSNSLNLTSKTTSEGSSETLNWYSNVSPCVWEATPEGFFEGIIVEELVEDNLVGFQKFFV